MIGTIFPSNVLDHLFTSIHAEVDVKVGHGHAIGIEEALEQEPERKGVKVGDLERIGNE